MFEIPYLVQVASPAKIAVLHSILIFTDLSRIAQLCKNVAKMIIKKDKK